MKTFLRGILFTLLGWVAYILILCLALVLSPFALIFIPVGAFMYANDPESIVKEDHGEDI